MIVGLGTDIVDMERVEKIAERFGERFAGHILHPEELELWREGPQATFLAGRFAAKEALVKALGTGFAEGIFLTDILVRKGKNGRPTAHLFGAALERLKALGGDRVHVSISHDRHSAMAVVMVRVNPLILPPSIIEMPISEITRPKAV